MLKNGKCKELGKNRKNVGKSRKVNLNFYNVKMRWGEFFLRSEWLILLIIVGV